MTAGPPADDPWRALRALTDARIGQPRRGASLATTAQLAFRQAQAAARDAVWQAFDAAALAAALGGAALIVDSAAPDRRTYLLRPDLGRRLGEGAAALLAPHAGDHDLVIVVTEGLSARAVQRHAAPVLDAALPSLRAAGWRLAPLVVVRGGRVAIGDAVAAALGAGAVAVLIGERPGLSAPDSMGAYVTWRPTPATTDAGRNCLSNIRPAGLGHAEAARRLVGLLRAMRASGRSGVGLTAAVPSPALSPPGNTPG